jgi:glycosyltransferase involved in cell wall biosynthesis
MPDVTYNCLALRPQGSGVQTYIRQMLVHIQSVRPEWQLRAVVQADAVVALPQGVLPLVRPTSTRVRRALEGLGSVGGADLMHGLDVDVPLRRRVPTVATVHDLAVFDVPRTIDRVRVAGERLLLAHAARSADVLIAVSHFTAEQISTHLHRTATVIHEAPAPDMRPATTEEVESCRSRYRLPERFVLYVGDFHARKGLDVLEAACRTADVALVVAGGHLAGRVPRGALALGYVPHPDLPALYSAATVFAFPSLYEGFGLPPLEAMACGTPVLASQIPPLREVLGEGARLVPPGVPDAWARAITEFFADVDGRTALAAAGRRRAAQFSWTDTAKATVALYREMGMS